ncbi:Uncharacterised protein [Yersinia pekkanenii]|uniref:Uncharacterized protein n=1 Tax=Yersinia pekkanenii TaxID=1288385 RepID=A0A0T9QJR4_9GAMM|nr:Uncharacterised protein [Yersinia pekkanenii]CRY68361.1 Uncharacterised protein [Yersinia pekkanenii]
MHFVLIKGRMRPFTFLYNFIFKKKLYLLLSRTSITHNLR